MRKTGQLKGLSHFGTQEARKDFVNPKYLECRARSGVSAYVATHHAHGNDTQMTPKVGQALNNGKYTRQVCVGCDRRQQIQNFQFTKLNQVLQKTETAPKKKMSNLFLSKWGLVSDQREGTCPKVTKENYKKIPQALFYLQKGDEKDNFKQENL